MNLPNASIEGTPKESRAMQALQRVTNSNTPPPNDPPSFEPPADIPVTKPPMKGEEAPSSDDYDIGETPTTASSSKEPPVESQDIDDIDRIIDIKGTSAENMKKLRTKLKGTHTELQTTKAELETLRQKVEQYESGTIVPEEIAALQSRIEELEPFQKIYNLETYPGYIEAISKPRQEVKDKLVGLATDYKVPLEVLDQAVSLDNRAELNRLLGAHFDEVGALEAKSLINEFKAISQKDADFRKEPDQARARLHSQTEAALQAKRQAEIDSIGSITKSAWSESLQALRQEDHIALTFRDGDTKHNETIARPILTKASKDYGVVMRVLGENGLKQLPQETAYVIARSIQLAHESAILRQQNDQMAEELVTLKRRLGDLNSLNRPGANGGGGSGSTGATREKGAVGAARAALSKVRK